MNRYPAFQFYPQDFLSDENVMMMSLAQQGAYIRLLSYCWIHGSLPAEPEKLATLCRCSPAEMLDLWEGLKNCFKEVSGRLLNPRLGREREKLRAYSAKMRQNGRKAHLPSRPRPSDGQAAAEPKPAISSSISFSSSSSKKETTKNGLQPALPGATASPSGKPNSEFQTAVTHVMESWKKGPGKGTANYPFTGRDGKTVKRMLGQQGLWEFIALWDEFLATDWKWFNNMNKTVEPPRSLAVFEAKLVELLERGGYKSRLAKMGGPPASFLPKMKGINDV